MTGEAKRIEDVETRFGLQIDKLTDAVVDLKNTVVTMSANAKASDKINDFKITALERLFDRLDKTDVRIEKNKEEVDDEIEVIKDELAETRGAIRVLRYVAGFLGLSGLGAFIKAVIG